MKTLPFLLLIVIFGCSKEIVYPDGDYFTDSRDNHVYKSITIGDQVWMAENLAYLPSLSSYSSVKDTTPKYYVYGYLLGTGVKLAKTTANYKTYGVLYSWTAALQACPSGWHLPSSKEFYFLFSYLFDHGIAPEGDTTNISKSLASKTHWITWDQPRTIGNDLSKNNQSGFNLFPSGQIDKGGSSFGLHQNAYLWTSNRNDEYQYHALGFWLSYMNSALDSVKEPEYISYKSTGLSVRCIKNN